MDWFLYDDDGHCYFNTHGHGNAIPAPPELIQALVIQQQKMMPVLIAWARIASNEQYGGASEDDLAEYVKAVMTYLTKTS